jgi:ubiquinone/menaquinone biosynthesis C-methylase UbiE
MARPTCAIPFQKFDGREFPFADRSFDAVQFIDVLHHVPDDVIVDLLREAVRVSDRYVVLKDHLWATRLDFLTLKIMDVVGNAPHGVEVVYNYKTEKYWRALFEELGTEVVSMTTRVPLYPRVVNAVFGRRLHFLAVLQIRDRPA